MKICDETVRAAVDSGLGSVRLDAAQKQAILAQCRPSVAVARPVRPLRRVLALAAAFAFAVCLGGGVLAAAPELQQKLAVLGEETMLLLQPVNQTSEDQGIRMDVLAAMSDGQVAAVYLSLQDTTGEGRITADTELYTPQVSGTFFTSSEVVDYDDATGTAILRLTADSNEQLAGRKITVGTTSIAGGQNFNDPVDLGYTLEEARRLTGGTQVEYSRTIDTWGTSGPRLEEYHQMVADGRMPTLTGWSEPLALPDVDWATVNAASVVDGRLHVQVNYLNEMGGVNRLHFGLQNAAGERVECTELELELGERHEMGAYRNYNDLMEYVLVPPPQSDPEELRITLETVTYDHFIRGKWSTTFLLEDASESLNIACDVDMNPWRVTGVQVSPIAITATGIGEMTAESKTAELEVWLADGTRVYSSGGSVFTDSESITTRNIFDRVIDLDQVVKVTLNGEELPLP